jgi:threonine dehydratase
MCAVNDNDVARLDNKTLIAALRHFARHGLAAAEHAGARALSALRERDRDSCQHWLAVCRQLDRRLADRISSKLGSFAA